MKKSLIALAALSTIAGSAMAQSSVTVYGTVDISYGDAKNEYTQSAGSVTTLKSKNTGNGDGALSTSVIGFKGTEDLGSGLKANFVLEYDLVDAGTGGNGNTSISKTAADSSSNLNRSVASADSINGLGARFSWVGVSDARLGELRLGRQAQSIHSVVVGGSAGAGNNVAGTIYSAGMNGNANDATIRPHLVFVNRAVTYVSPTFNGLTAEIQTANHDVDNNGVVSYAKETGGSLKYAQGKFTAAYGIATTELDDTSWTTTGNTKYKQQALNATYDLGVAKLFALQTKRKDTVANAFVAETKVNELGVSAPYGRFTVWASAFSGDRDGSYTTAVTDLGTTAATLTSFNKASADVKGQQVGVKYDLSKRTAAYAIWGKQSIKATVASTANAQVETTQTAVGIRHAF